MVVFKGFEDYVPGSGIKYADYSLGAGLPEVNPFAINPKLDMSEILPITFDYLVSQNKIDAVEMAIKQGIQAQGITKDYR
jgi:hypothetical protein